jgi:hypothetical protein
MPIDLIPTAADVALEGSTTHMDFAGGDGWVMSQDYAMHVPSPPDESAKPENAGE